MNDDLRELYQEVILDHGRRPRNKRHPERVTHSARGHNPLCGDQVEVFLDLDAEGQIKDLAFEGRGCAISVASASLMTETLRGRTVADARALFGAVRGMCAGGEPGAPAADLEDAVERLGVLAGVREFPMRVKCATLAWHTLKAAIDGRGEASSDDEGEEGR